MQIAQGTMMIELLALLWVVQPGPLSMWHGYALTSNDG
jgi:hypothetical protein